MREDVSWNYSNGLTYTYTEVTTTDSTDVVSYRGTDLDSSQYYSVKQNGYGYWELYLEDQVFIFRDWNALQDYVRRNYQLKVSYTVDQFFYPNSPIQRIEDSVEEEPEDEDLVFCW